MDGDKVEFIKNDLMGREWSQQTRLLCKQDYSRGSTCSVHQIDAHSNAKHRTVNSKNANASRNFAGMVQRRQRPLCKRETSVHGGSSPSPGST